MEHPKVRVVDEFLVAPPPGSLPATLHLPLTFFDLRFLIISHKHTIRTLFFYANPQSLHDFNQTTIPSLKSSLSLTLQYFYPFVSNLILPPHPQKPHILFAKGNSVSFTVAHYSGGGGDDFNHFISDQVKDFKVLYPFAPSLAPTRVSPDGTRVDSLFAIQVTLFPNQGFCIGVGFRHTIVDAIAFSHFMKSWASICRCSCARVNQLDKFLVPSFSRDSILDPYEIESRQLRKLRDIDWGSQIPESLTNYMERKFELLS
ncbi:hypothetical protein ACFE04_016475 [Oxalis oulophora]